METEQALGASSFHKEYFTRIFFQLSFDTQHYVFVFFFLHLPMYLYNGYKKSVFSGFFLGLECSMIKTDFSGNKERYTAGAKSMRRLRGGLW